MAHKKRRGNTVSKKDQGSNLLECFYCGRLVKASAVKCKYCGKWFSSGKKLVIGIIFAIALIIILSFAVQSLFGEVHRPYRPDIDLNDLIIEDDVTTPVGDADISGRVTEMITDHSFSLETRDRESQSSSIEYVTLGENANVFWINMETNSVTRGFISDIETSSMMQLWGTQDIDGDWYATDIGLMTGRPGRP